MLFPLNYVYVMFSFISSFLEKKFRLESISTSSSVNHHSTQNLTRFYVVSLFLTFDATLEPLFSVHSLVFHFFLNVYYFITIVIIIYQILGVQD